MPGGRRDAGTASPDPAPPFIRAPRSALLAHHPPQHAQTEPDRQGFLKQTGGQPTTGLGRGQAAISRPRKPRIPPVPVQLSVTIDSEVGVSVVTSAFCMLLPDPSGGCETSTHRLSSGPYLYASAPPDRNTSRLARTPASHRCPSASALRSRLDTFPATRWNSPP